MREEEQPVRAPADEEPRRHVPSIGRRRKQSWPPLGRPRHRSFGCLEYVMPAVRHVQFAGRVALGFLEHDLAIRIDAVELHAAPERTDAPLDVIERRKLLLRELELVRLAGLAGVPAPRAVDAL